VSLCVQSRGWQAAAHVQNYSGFHYMIDIGVNTPANDTASLYSNSSVGCAGDAAASDPDTDAAGDGLWKTSYKPTSAGKYVTIHLLQFTWISISISSSTIPSIQFPASGHLDFLPGHHYTLPTSIKPRCPPVGEWR
jgi:hypothetical protein